MGRRPRASPVRMPASRATRIIPSQKAMTPIRPRARVTAFLAPLDRSCGDITDVAGESPGHDGRPPRGRSRFRSTSLGDMDGFGGGVKVHLRLEGRLTGVRPSASGPLPGGSVRENGRLRRRFQSGTARRAARPAPRSSRIPLAPDPACSGTPHGARSVTRKENRLLQAGHSPRETG